MLHAADEHDVGQVHGDLHKPDLNSRHGRGALLVDELRRKCLGQVGQEDGDSSAVGPLFGHGRGATYDEIVAFGADDSLCAEVKLDISQGLTLERQAFDAHMRINNGLTHITLEDVNVEVRFSDEEGNTVLASSDPNNTTALFFINLNSLENISAVDGTGTVQPATAADIH